MIIEDHAYCLAYYTVRLDFFSNASYLYKGYCKYLNANNLLSELAEIDTLNCVRIFTPKIITNKVDCRTLIPKLL